MKSSLSSLVANASCQTTLPDGSVCSTITMGEVMRLAEREGVLGREIERAALERRIVPDRYLRNQRLVNAHDQIRLLEASVCVIGLGGLGGLVSDTLARMGVGSLHLVDGDRFESHNLNRQLFSNTDNLGLPKAREAERHLKTINPGITVTARQTYLDNDNANRLIHGCDLVADCLDNIPSRLALATAANQNHIPMVSGAIAGLCGQVTTAFPGDAGPETLFGSQRQTGRTKGVETTLGCLAPGVNLVASLMCAEIFNVLLGKANTLRNKLLVIDLGDYTFEIVALA